MKLAPAMLAPTRTAVFAALLLSLGLSACQREAAPQNAADSAPTVNPAPITDQPAENVPPATAPVSNPPPANGIAQARFDGYGDMRFGMSADEAKKAWGGELKGEAAADGGCFYLRPIWVTAPRDFGFMFEAGKLVRLDVGNDKEAAPGGGKRGMSADEIGKLYAGRVEASPHKYVQGAKTLRVTDSGGGSGVLVFETDGSGKVTSWRVGVPPQVDYVEGCG